MCLVINVKNIMTKVRNKPHRHKHLNDILIDKKAGRHEPKHGNKAKRSRRKQNDMRES